jgi:hypothetical protein
LVYRQIAQTSNAGPAPLGVHGGAGHNTEGALSKTTRGIPSSSIYDKIEPIITPDLKNVSLGRAELREIMKTSVKHA